ncbi:MAG: transposase [Lachnospiraceae bacterium]|nr:transposase [Lachnospiraceae bacterium]
MGRKASGKDRVDYIEKRQSNGTIYVYKRISAYNPEKGYYQAKEQKLLGKKMPDSDEIIPTRPKAPNGSRRKNAADRTEKEGVSATRVRIGASAIIDHIGKVSGIDDDVYKSCDDAVGKKIISLARYYLQSDGEATSHIEKWQLTHLMEPYGHPISEDTAHDLFVRIGADETISQGIFVNRANHLEDTKVIAYDASTVSTYGQSHTRARYGYNKDNDGLETDKLFTFYSIDTRQPVCYMNIPGNIPDIMAVENATKQLDVMGLKGAEIITDCGFYSENNLSLLFQSSFNFITRAQHDLKWIRPEVDKALVNIGDTANMSQHEPGTYGVSVCLTHEFEKTRKYGNQKKGLHAGDKETFQRRVYLHIFFNDVNQTKKNRALDDTLSKLRTEYIAGQREFKPAAQKMIDRYLLISEKRNGKIEIQFRTNEIRLAKKYNGVFVLVSNKEKDPFEALRKFRRREWIEDFFEEYKQRIGGKKNRVWDDLTLDGKRLVQFIALCYYEYFSKELNELKDVLGVKNGEHDHDLKANIDKEKRLKNWLDNTSIQEIFDWFDAVEKVDVSTPYAKQVWTTEVIERDRLFLEKLGVSL